jgi:hypothetical protein
VDIATEDGPVGPADETSVRAIFARDGGFWDFVILSRGDDEFLQGGHWYWVGRNTDNTVWHAAFDRATIGKPQPDDDSRDPDLYAVEFRDPAGQFAVHQVFAREQLLDLFLAYLGGGDGWRAGLSWEPLALG